MRKGELTRQYIVEKAAAVFNQRGFSGCSMQNVMEATGLEKGGLYRHFPSKEDLAVESFKYAMQRTVAARLKDAGDGCGAMARLMQAVRAFVEVPSPIPGGCPLMNAAADVDAGSKRITNEARDAVGAWRSKLCDLVNEGIASGEFHADIDPRQTANALISMLEGALMICRLEGNRQAMLDAQSSLGVLLSALTTRSRGNAGQ